MPFLSTSQRAWFYANEPELAKRWEKHTKKKKLPKHVKKHAKKLKKSNLKKYVGKKRKSKKSR